MVRVHAKSQEAFETPPDFSFPPECKFSSPTIAENIMTSPERTKFYSPPNFGFPLSPNPPMRIPSARPTELPEITTPITPLEVSMPRLGLNGLVLLAIPLEIRLQIYHYVLLSHPIHHAHLSLNINNTPKREEFHTGMLRPNGLSFPTSSQLQLLTTINFPSSLTSDPLCLSNNASTSVRIRHNRPTQIQGKMPTSLLVSCTQIYTEAHTLPFTTSYFAFVNWFRSGVYTARHFSLSLRAWQSSSLRFTSVDVLGRDLRAGGMARLDSETGERATRSRRCDRQEIEGAGEFRELCGLWEGVWGLRLGIKGSVLLDEKVADVETQVGWNGVDGEWPSPDAESQDEASLGRKEHIERGILSVQMNWVVDGLLRMKSLRWIELEIEDQNIDRDVKIEFCVELEAILTELRDRDDGWLGNVQVVFVERITARGGQSEGKWYIGEPGDEEVWADDS